MRISILLTCIWVAAAAFAQSYPQAERIVSVGGPITEIIYALNEEHRIAARDTTSVFPSEANALPDVGYMRQLSAEGVLSVAPDLIIARDTSGPPEAIEQLQSTSVPLVLVHDGFSASSVVDAIHTVGEALGVTEKSDALARTVQDDLDRLATRVAALDRKKRVLFVLSLDGGRMNAAGRDTGADGIITLAGGKNIMSEKYSGYKLVDAEAIVTAAPEVIIMIEGRGDHSARQEEVLSMPQVKLTPAGREGAFVTLPGAALGFGPRAGQFGLELYETLYGAQD